MSTKSETKAKRPRQPAKLKWQEELLLTTQDAAKVLHIGRTSLYNNFLMKIGPNNKPLLHSVKIGQKRLVPVDALKDFIASLGKAAS